MVARTYENAAEKTDRLPVPSWKPELHVVSRSPEASSPTEEIQVGWLLNLLEKAGVSWECSIGRDLLSSQQNTSLRDFLSQNGIYDSDRFTVLQKTVLDDGRNVGLYLKTSENKFVRIKYGTSVQAPIVEQSKEAVPPQVKVELTPYEIASLIESLERKIKGNERIVLDGTEYSRKDFFNNISAILTPKLTTIIHSALSVPQFTYALDGVNYQVKLVFPDTFLEERFVIENNDQRYAIFPKFCFQDVRTGKLLYQQRRNPVGLGLSPVENVLVTDYDENFVLFFETKAIAEDAAAITSDDPDLNEITPSNVAIPDDLEAEPESIPLSAETPSIESPATPTAPEVVKDEKDPVEISSRQDILYAFLCQHHVSIKDESLNDVSLQDLLDASITDAASQYEWAFGTTHINGFVEFSFVWDDDAESWTIQGLDGVLGHQENQEKLLSLFGSPEEFERALYSFRYDPEPFANNVGDKPKELSQKNAVTELSKSSYIVHFGNLKRYIFAVSAADELKGVLSDPNANYVIVHAKDARFITVFKVVIGKKGAKSYEQVLCLQTITEVAVARRAALAQVNLILPVVEGSNPTDLQKKREERLARIKGYFSSMIDVYVSEHMVHDQSKSTTEKMFHAILFIQDLLEKLNKPYTVLQDIEQYWDIPREAILGVDMDSFRVDLIRSVEIKIRELVVTRLVEIRDDEFQSQIAGAQMTVPDVMRRVLLADRVDAAATKQQQAKAQENYRLLVRVLQLDRYGNDKNLAVFLQFLDAAIDPQKRTVFLDEKLSENDAWIAIYTQIIDADQQTKYLFNSIYPETVMNGHQKQHRDMVQRLKIMTMNTSTQSLPVLRDIQQKARDQVFASLILQYQELLSQFNSLVAVPKNPLFKIDPAARERAALGVYYPIARQYQEKVEAFREAHKPAIELISGVQTVIKNEQEAAKRAAETVQEQTQTKEDPDVILRMATLLATRLNNDQSQANINDFVQYILVSSRLKILQDQLKIDPSKDKQHLLIFQALLDRAVGSTVENKPGVVDQLKSLIQQHSIATNKRERAKIHHEISTLVGNHLSEIVHIVPDRIVNKKQKITDKNKPKIVDTVMEYLLEDVPPEEIDDDVMEDLVSDYELDDEEYSVMLALISYLAAEEGMSRNKIRSQLREYNSQREKKNQDWVDFIYHIYGDVLDVYLDAQDEKKVIDAVVQQYAANNPKLAGKIRQLAKMKLKSGMTFEQYMRIITNMATVQKQTIEETIDRLLAK